MPTASSEASPLPRNRFQLRPHMMRNSSNLPTPPPPAKKKSNKLIMWKQTRTISKNKSEQLLVKKITRRKKRKQKRKKQNRVNVQLCANPQLATRPPPPAAWASAARGFEDGAVQSRGLRRLRAPGPRGVAAGARLEDSPRSSRGQPEK